MRTAYNTQNAASALRYSNIFNQILTATVTVPERPCPPDMPNVFETPNKVTGLTGGPNIQFTDDWATIQGSSAKRGAGKGAPLLSAIGDAT